MNYTLPETATVGGVEYSIRSDYRAALDICAVLSDMELTNADKAYGALVIFYPALCDMPPEHYEAALRELMLFLNCGEPDRGGKSPKLVSWEQDFPRIVSAINKTTGTDVRGMEYLHWWTFISYFNEIDGETTFAAIVRIRSKLRKHKKLDKAEQEFYRANREIVDFQAQYTDE
ncbi:MAG: hypothetical protein IJV43_05735, partial [Oscillospiraceae bacterium]|nr:hypothetical protein [Oscillospiraceae bacterium]MBQ9720271.1 hypothetical protein [Oscillospiraceae bacterium]